MTNEDKIIIVFCILLSILCAAAGLIYLGYALAGWLAS
jgi:hypothetical protein